MFGPQPESHPFGIQEWGLLATAAIMWGCSFVLIARALEQFSPLVIATGRVAGGFATLGAFSQARGVRMPREAWPRIAVIAATWMAIPFTCFALAGQWISSALAGMLNSGVPILTAMIAVLAFNRRATRRQFVGLLIGFVGTGLIAAPKLAGGANAGALGVVLCLVAVTCYGIATNVMVPLQMQYGTLPVLWRAQGIAIVVTTPFAVVGVTRSDFSWGALLSVLALGVFGTGIAFIAAGTLIGRVGATRGVLSTYFAPIVAIVVGVMIRHDHIEWLSLTGIPLVLCGAYVASRGVGSRTSETVAQIGAP